jgi:hypothetical protein
MCNTCEALSTCKGDSRARYLIVFPHIPTTLQYITGEAPSALTEEGDALRVCGGWFRLQGDRRWWRQADVQGWVQAGRGCHNGESQDGGSGAMEFLCAVGPPPGQGRGRRARLHHQGTPSALACFCCACPVILVICLVVQGVRVWQSLITSFRVGTPSALGTHHAFPLNILCSSAEVSFHTDACIRLKK